MIAQAAAALRNTWLEGQAGREEEGARAEQTRSMKGTALSVCIHISAKLKQQETRREEKGNEQRGSAASAERLPRRLLT